MVVVRFHATDIPVVLLTSIEDILLDIITETSDKVSAHPLPKNAGFLRPPFFLDHDVFLDLMLSWQEEFPTPSCFFAMEENQGGLLMPPLSATLITVIRYVRLHKGMAHKKWPNLVGSDHTCSGARRRVGGYHASQQ